MQNSKIADIVLEQVYFSYNGEPVLENVNLTIDRGEFIGIIGPNGGGKTTLLRLILGLLTPDSGTIHVFGRPPKEVSYRIGYVPQHLQFDPRFPATVFDIVRMGQIGRRRFGRQATEEKRAADDALAAVGLSPYKNKSFIDLSGGQRQRALIARALASDPHLLLFDEPTANVDSTAGEKLYQILAELNKRMTILVVSHDIGFVNHHITSVVCVNHQVVIHPTSALVGQNIIDLYGQDISLVRHDHRCSGEGHSCSNS
ncbi:MAG TPA: ATP-binding cassette domain-containing protein [Desulfobulbaceae bacterium]|nr:ATP-binding cassette domain-containing protein [Desulfobulbaceae bacterium]